MSSRTSVLLPAPFSPTRPTDSPAPTASVTGRWPRSVQSTWMSSPVLWWRNCRQNTLWLPVVLASAAASIAAYYLVGSPWHVSIGAAAGILLAAIMTPGDAPAHPIEEAADD